MITDHDRLRAIKAIGLRWTDLMLDLEAGPQPMTCDQSLNAVTSAIAFWSHPLLTDENIRDLARGLNRASLVAQRYECFGTWEHEDNNSMEGRTHDERLAFLATDVDRWAFRLLTGLEACLTCVHTLPVEQWQPEQPSRTSPFRCTEHAAAELDEWRAWNNTQRKLALVQATS